jgi:hypothetical protein
LAGVFVAAAPDAFAAADVVFAEVDALVVEGLIEDEEFQLGAEVGGVGDAVFSGIGGALRAMERGSRLYSFLVIGSRTSQMIDSVVCCMNGSMLGRGGDGDQEHVAFVDRLPTADAGAVEAEAVAEAFQGELTGAVVC